MGLKAEARAPGRGALWQNNFQKRSGDSEKTGNSVFRDLVPRRFYESERTEIRSTSDLGARLALVEREALGPSLVPVDELSMIEPHEVENGGMEIVDMQAVLDGMEA